MRIAIVDDDAAMRVVMNGHCLRYGEERGMHFDVECFSNGDDLLADYRRGACRNGGDDRYRRRIAFLRDRGDPLC